MYSFYTASPSLTPSVDPPPSGVSGGTIAGVVIGVVVVIIVLVLSVVAVLVIVIYQRRRGLCVLSVLHASCYFHVLGYGVLLASNKQELPLAHGKCSHYQEVVMSYSVVCYIQ